MSAKSFSAVAVACLLTASLVFSNTAQAAAQQNQLSQQEVDKILQREQKLEQQVSVLNAEIKDIKTQQHSDQRYSETRYHSPEKGFGNTVWRPAHPQVTPEQLKRLNASQLTRGVSVTSSPYMGLRSAYDGSDLLVNISSMNEDLRLLQQRQKLENQVASAGISPDAVDRPLIELSGAIEGQGVYNKPYQGTSNNSIALSRAEFDLLSYISPWVTGFMSVKYDASALPANIQGSGQRAANSRMYLNRGFMTIGNLNKAPVYLSLGLMNAPFGRYFSEMLTNPPTQTFGQTRDPMALLGFYKDGIYAEGYAFQGDANTSSNNNGINNGGVNVGYKYDNGTDVVNVGAGAINDIADSLGMQKTGAPSMNFQGFGFSSGTETLVHLVPAVDVHGRLTLNKLTLYSEYITATRSFDPMDLSYNNNSGAKPSALHLEGDYNFNMFNWPSVFTLAYGHSWQALGVNIPKDSYIAEVTTSIWKDTIESIEFRHDQNYPTSDTSGGSGFPVLASTGGSQNTVTLQAGVYF